MLDEDATAQDGCGQGLTTYNLRIKEMSVRVSNHALRRALEREN